MLCAAYDSVSVKHLATRYSPLSLIALQGLSGTLFFAPFLFFVELPAVHNSHALISILIVFAGVLVSQGHKPQQPRVAEFAAKESRL